MALSRLFFAGGRIHFHRKEFLRQTRTSFSSSSGKTEKLPQSKKAEAAKEQRAEAVESYVKNYMQMHPGVFPKVYLVQKEVGGSYYLLKDILAELGEKMSSKPQIQKQVATESLDAMVDTTASEAIKASERLDTTELNELKSRVQPSDVTVSDVTAEKSSEVLARSEDSLHAASIFELGDGYQQSKANSSRAVTSGRYHEAIFEALSCLQGRLASKENASRELGGAGSDEVTSVENREHSPHKVPTFLAQNDCSKAKDMSSSVGSVEKLPELTDLYLKRNDTLTRETYSDLAKGSSGDHSMKRHEIMSLIDRIKELPNKTLQTRSNDHSISSKINQLNNGCRPRHTTQVADALRTSKLSNSHEQQKSLYDLFAHDDFKKHDLHNKQIEEPKETNVFTSMMRNTDKGTLARSDDCVTCDRNNLPNENEEDPRRKVSFEIFNSQILSDEESRSSSDDAAFDYTKSEPSSQIPLPYKKEPPKRDPTPFLFTAKGSGQTTLLVRFVRKIANVKDIEAAFEDCGPIEGIRLIPSSKESRFKDAYINFKTKDGLQRALAKTDVAICDRDVVIEAARPSTNMPNRFCAPDLVGDPDVPTGLLENPTRSVMVKELPRDLTLDHLREALSFCGGSISGFYMGSSSSVAYIEFETEDAKEKAIAASSVTISGRRLSILRIDVPRTTVVRISNVSIETRRRQIQNICSLHGQVKKIVERGSGTFDVHFKLSEWLNVVNILNSLNGKIVDENQWIAQPATVIPDEILLSLWNKPDGRKHVHSVIQNLCKKLEENFSGVAKLNQIAAKFYGNRA